MFLLIYNLTTVKIAFKFITKMTDTRFLSGPKLETIVPVRPRFSKESVADVPEPRNELNEHQPGAAEINWEQLNHQRKTGVLGNKKFPLGRYTVLDWNQRVMDIYNTAQQRHEAAESHSNAARTRVECIAEAVDAKQHDTTLKIKARSGEVHANKSDLTRAIAEMAGEIDLLHKQKTRVRNAYAIVLIPEAIVNECLSLRENRLDEELVCDPVEEQLHRESHMIHDVKNRLLQLSLDIQTQMKENVAGKERCEMDWSDKKIAFDTDAYVGGLNNKSQNWLLSVGCTRVTADQSTHAQWKEHVSEIIHACDATRELSQHLRNTVNEFLQTCARDLRKHADRTEAALLARIDATHNARILLENQLKQTLEKISELEKLMEHLRDFMQRVTCVLKIAQTRLKTRHTFRERVENCADAAQEALVKECVDLEGQIATLGVDFSETEARRVDLLKSRVELEREVMLKRKTVQIDQQRCQRIRAFYPSIVEMSGY